MIELRNVSKWYGTFQVLRDCSTRVGQGEVVRWSDVAFDANLAAVDRAIGASRAALAAQPDSAEAQASLIDMLRAKAPPRPYG